MLPNVGCPLVRKRRKRRMTNKARRELLKGKGVVVKAGAK